MKGRVVEKPFPSNVPLVAKQKLSENLTEVEVRAPLIAKAAQPGNFVLVRGDERGERIPLTIANSDADGRHHHAGDAGDRQGHQELAGFEVGQSYSTWSAPWARTA